MKAKLLMMLACIVLLAACKNRGNYELGPTSSEADSVKVDADAVISNGPKLVKRAAISFKVKNVQQCSEKIEVLTISFKGMTMRHQISSSISGSKDIKIKDDSVLRVSSFQTSGEITVKIPSEKLQAFTDSISRLGIYVTNNQMDIDDRSLDYLSAQLKLKDRKELAEQQKAGKVIIKDPTAVINLKDDLVDEQINNRKIDDAVKYSIVDLSFYQSNTILKEVIANDDPSSYSIPFFRRLDLALGNGWQIFKETLILITDIWVFILAAGVIWWVVRYYKRKPVGV